MGILSVCCCSDGRAEEVEGGGRGGGGVGAFIVFHFGLFTIHMGKPFGSRLFTLFILFIYWVTHKTLYNTNKRC